MYYKRALLGMALVGLAVIVAVSNTATAQQTNSVLTGMEANGKQLRQYTFKQRTETYHKGELKNARIDEIHYDATGERVAIPLGEQKPDHEARRRGPGSRIMGKKIKEEQEKMKEYIDRLMSLTSRYLAPDPEKLRSAIGNASIAIGGPEKQTRVTMRDYVKTGDTMTMSFDSRTKRPVKTEVTTSLDEAPVSIILLFDQIREGPNYPGRTVVKSDSKQLEVRVFTYDYRM